MREMKVLKGISLFFIYPLIMLLVGFGCGMQAERFFYPGEEVTQKKSQELQSSVSQDSEMEKVKQEENAEMVTVTSQKEKLTADTKYCVEEVDVLRENSVETQRTLPSQYIGMTKEQFLATMENYQSAPPLNELERGFESLEVLAFSSEQVRVRMNYRYVQPGQEFYLAVINHEVVVYLEDKETVYINNTGIMLDTLPEDMQLKIIQMHYIEGEGDLYSFLETYSS